MSVVTVPRSQGKSQTVSVAIPSSRASSQIPIDLPVGIDRTRVFHTRECSHYVTYLSFAAGDFEGSSRYVQGRKCRHYARKIAHSWLYGWLKRFMIISRILKPV